MCPGPILVNLGEGKVYALGALAGALVGASLFGLLYERLSGPLRLPALKTGEAGRRSSPGYPGAC